MRWRGQVCYSETISTRAAKLIELVHKQSGIPKELKLMVFIENMHAVRLSDAELAELEQQFFYGKFLTEKTFFEFGSNSSLRP